MLRELGPAYDAVLGRHRELLRGAWEAHNGHEVQTIGDAFLVVFGDSASAVAAAVAAQRALVADAWPGRVRIGLHTGHARPTNGDYTALVVHQAAADRRRRPRRPDSPHPGDRGGARRDPRPAARVLSRP